MEPRKIIKFGNSSYVITLPSEWLKKNNLEKGSSVNLIENGDSILIKTNFQKKEKRAIIKINDVPLKIFNRELISYYLKNFKFIEIQGENVLEKLEQIKIFKEKLSSVEIFEINKNSIILKDLTSAHELEICSIIRDIIKMEKIIFDELIKEDSKASYTIVTNLDVNINKLSFLGYKAINYNLDVFSDQEQVKDAIYYRRIVSSLETIGDIIKRIARYLKDETNEHNLYIGQTLKEIKEYFEFLTNLLDNNVKLDNNLKLYLDKKQSLLREFEALRNKLHDDLNLYLVVTQLFKDILGQLDEIILSIIDLNCK